MRLFVCLYLDERNEIESDVENGIEKESKRVQRQEVEVQANHAPATAIVINLRIEGDRPCDEVAPTDYTRNQNQRWRNGYDYTNEYVRNAADQKENWLFAFLRMKTFASDSLDHIFRNCFCCYLNVTGRYADQRYRFIQL